MAQFWSVLLHLHVPALFFHPFQKPFVWDFSSPLSRWRAYSNCVITVAQISEWSVYFEYVQVLSLKTQKLNSYYYYYCLVVPWVSIKIFSCLVCLTENRSVPQLCPVIHACWLQREGFSPSCYWTLLDHHISCWYNNLALSALIITYYKNHITRYVYPQNWRGRWQNRRSAWCAGRP